MFIMCLDINWNVEINEDFYDWVLIGIRILNNGCYEYRNLMKS